MRSLGVVFVLLAACGGSAPKAAEPATNAGGAGAPEAATLTFVSVEQGDVACYVTVRDDAGVEATYPGSFELCAEGGAPAPGTRVTLTWGRATLLAASCEGNPDCADHEEADIVETITVAP
jgi:hypothetical protein